MDLVAVPGAGLRRLGFFAAGLLALLALGFARVDLGLVFRLRRGIALGGAGFDIGLGLSDRSQPILPALALILVPSRLTTPNLTRFMPAAIRSTCRNADSISSQNS